MRTDNRRRSYQRCRGRRKDIELPSELEFNIVGFEAGNLLPVVVVDIGVNRVFTLIR